jgi:16S rRNA (cytosine967-C5)-methyltransferase
MSRAPRSKPSAVPSARGIAARVLERVLDDAAFTSAALDAELRRHPQLPARERALATELVYGCVRLQSALLARLTALAPRGLPKGDVRVLSHLMVAAHQILVLDRVPDFAAVDHAVTEIRKLRGQAMAGFANAVLRKLAASERRLDPAAAIFDSAPSWLVRRLGAVVGPDEARALIGTGEPAPSTLRVLRDRPLPDWLQQAPHGRWSDCARVYGAGGDPRDKPGFSDGVFVVQEEGSQLVALSLGARPSERILDACAGRGQKASLFAEQLAGTGELWATDLYPAKLRALGAEFERLRLAAPRTSAVDWAIGAGEVPGAFDRVLVDSPCTGTGTLRRRPEILARMKPEDPARLGELSTRILRNVATRARAFGRVVFAVCSVLPEEAEAVVEGVTDLLEPSPFDAPEIVAFVGPDATSFRLLPGKHGTDGYFVASFLRKG